MNEPPVTAKEAAKLTGRSENWLRTHECAWCNQTLLNAIRHGCGAISYGPNPLGEIEDCQPREKRKPWWKS